MRKTLNTIRILGIAVALLACVWGCSENTFEWKERSDPRIVSLVDDSLALLYNRRSYEKCRDGVGPLGYTDCTDGGSNEGLYLVNYKKKQPIYWGDTLDYAVNFMRGFYADSSVFFFVEDDEKFGFWKIGSKPKNLKNVMWRDPCEKDHGAETRYRPWKDGNILLIGARGCNYAVLDTATGWVSELSIDDKYAWFKECEDITYLDGREICLKAIYEDSRYGVWIYENGNKTDSLVWENAKWSIVSENNVKIAGGKVFLLDHPTRLLNRKSNSLNGWSLNIIRPLNPVSPMMRIDKIYSLFIDSMGVETNYEAEDLYVIKGR